MMAFFSLKFYMSPGYVSSWEGDTYPGKTVFADPAAWDTTCRLTRDYADSNRSFVALRVSVPGRGRDKESPPSWNDLHYRPLEVRAFTFVGYFCVLSPC